MNAIILRRRKLGRTSCREIAAAMKSEIAVVRNDQDIPAVKHVFRWGTTSNVPKCNGQVIYNSAASIHWCANKRQGRLDMQAAGVPVPSTWDSFDSYQNDPIYVGPVVFRKAQHAQGRELYVHYGDDGLYERCSNVGVVVAIVFWFWFVVGVGLGPAWACVGRSLSARARSR